jgi:uncharacterized membrane protein
MPESVPFRLRGREVSRVEAFSDVVFGFALTLIVVSLEVPTEFAELMKMMRGFPGFAICFAMLTWLWHVHHTFFRRYALTDEITVTLNTVLLFLVLFYTYPLKFVFAIVTGQIPGTARDAGTLFIIYGLGFAGIFAVYVLMYVHAYRKREELELNVLEVHDTKSAILMYSSHVAIGLLSAGIGMFAEGYTLNFAGWTYFLLGPASGGIGYWRGSARHKLQVEYAQMLPNSRHTEATASVAAVGPT